MAKKSKGKGKAPKGRAGQKQKSMRNASSQSGSPFVRQSPAWARQQLLGDDDDDDDFDTRRAFKGFAQASPLAAHTGPRVPAFKLRDQKIAFVSAGSSTPKETPPAESEEGDRAVGREDQQEEDDDDEGEDEDEEEEDEEDIQIVDLQTNIPSEPDVRVSESAMANMNLDGPADDLPAASNQPTDAPLFFIDTEGDPSLTASSRLPPRKPSRRAPSPARSDSSDEVVVFHGRKRVNVVNDPISPAAPRVAAAQTSLPSKPATTPHAEASPRTDTVDILIAPDSISAAQPTLPQQPTPANAGPISAALQARPATPRDGSYTPNEQAADNEAFTASGWGAKPPMRDQDVNHDATWAPAPAGSWWRAQQQEPQEQQEQEQPASAEETIGHLQAMWKQVLRDKKQSKHSEAMQIDSSSSRQGSRSADVIKLEGSKSNNRRGKRGRKKDNRQLRSGGDEMSDDIDDEEDEAAYIDYMENLKRQLDEEDGQSGGEVKHAFASTSSAHNAALAGPSLVIDGEVIPEGEVLDPNAHPDEDGDEDFTADSGGWVSTDSDGDDDNEDEEDDDDAELDSSELEDELEYTEEQQWEDEEDLRRRRVEAMTDEQIARLYAKQQELGIDGDEIILEDGSFMSDDEMDGFGDIDAARAGIAGMNDFTFGRRSGGSAKQPRRKSGRAGPTFVDASALADTVEQYGEKGFDIMDFDRPSLRPTKKQRKGRLPPELEALSDDDLRESLSIAWTNDRSRKAAKKAKREALRAEGMLSGGATTTGKADLSAKYPNGMSMAQIYEELRSFLADDGMSTRPFPPMNKNHRKELHEIANAVKLKSKSVGSGNHRFPVLVKTKATVYSDKRLADAIRASEKGSLGGGGGKKSGGKGRGAAGGGGAGKGGGFSKAAVGLRNGEVVGAGAAEIGKENFGHRMMEKMGWSKGQALGKAGEGRLMPVEQIMRSGRAGLG